MKALWSCCYLGDSALKFIDVKTIRSVVAMIPHRVSIEGRPAEDRFFLVEKPGFDVALHDTYFVFATNTLLPPVLCLFVFLVYAEFEPTLTCQR